mmetsp:Transcript_37433/g.94467  ORF Transcript_37433/g.94467 Transcript_37433/m.94467 type:complete len:221 (-) Transcript_37433:185-847(-)
MKVLTGHIHDMMGTPVLHLLWAIHPPPPAPICMNLEMVKAMAEKVPRMVMTDLIVSFFAFSTDDLSSLMSLSTLISSSVVLSLMPCRSSRMRPFSRFMSSRCEDVSLSISCRTSVRILSRKDCCLSSSLFTLAAWLSCALASSALNSCTRESCSMITFSNSFLATKVSSILILFSMMTSVMCFVSSSACSLDSPASWNFLDMLNVSTSRLRSTNALVSSM